MSPQSVSPSPLQAPATLRVFEGSLFKPSVSHCHQDLEDLGTVCMVPREQLDQSEGPLHCRTGTHRQAHGRASIPLSSPHPNPTPAPRRELRTSREFLEEHTVANCACLSVPLSQFQQLAYTSGPGCQTTKMKSHLVFLTGCLLEAALHWSESQVCSGYPFRAGDYSGLTDPFHGSGSLHSG